MIFVKIKDNVVNKYPYTSADLFAEFPNTSFPSDLELADLSSFGVFKVIKVDKPVVNYTDVVEEGIPVFDDGNWIQVWNTRLATPAEQSAAMTKIVKEFTDAVQLYLDSVAQTRNYSNIISACSYAAGTHPKYSAEGKACLKWRENVWDACYQILNDVQTGNRPMPTIEQVISELPVITWP